MNESDILQKIAQLLRDHGESDGDVAPKLVLGYSGGLDSTVLLHLLVNSPLRSKLKALHVHHGLSVHADSWVDHCVHQCEKLGVPLQVVHVEVRAEGKGLEDAAREQRYRAFQGRMTKQDVLLLAHHQNDQAETVLFRLARGTGLNGLVGMSLHRALGELTVLRPLLNVRRADLEAYAKAHDLGWVEDESNASDAFDRNYIRQRIVPVFEQRWPHFVKRLADTSSNLAEAQSVLNEYLHDDLIALARRKERVGESVCLARFSCYRPARQKALVLAWCELAALDVPNRAQLEKLNEVLEAKEDAQPCLNWGNAELRRYDARLFLLPRLRYQAYAPQVWRVSESLCLARFSLRCLNVDHYAPGTELTVRTRTNAERCRPLERQHSQTVKKLLQEYRLEPWLRPIVPCVYSQDELVAVADLWQCADVCLSPLPELSWQCER